MTRRLLILMLMWQLAVLLLALLGSAFRRGTPLEETTIEEHPWLEPLVLPSTADREQLLRRVEHLKSLHVDALQLSQEAVERYRLNPKDTSIAEWSRTSSRGWPSFYRSYMRIVAPLPSETYAVEAARHCVCTDEVLGELEALSRLAESQAYSWQTAIRHARILVHVGRGAFAEAARLIPNNPNRLPNEPDRLIHVLQEVEARPDSFRHRMNLIEALAWTTTLSEATPVHADLLWRAYEVANDDAERTEALLALAALDRDRRGPAESSLAHALYTNCAALGCRDDALREQVASALAALAGYAAATDDGDAALVLYGYVAERLQGTRSWGVAIFNQAYLLREAHRPAAAIEAVSPIFDSNVNDRDPGPHLMEAYRNYRHRSARLVADAYRDQWNYPAAWLWEWRAVERYPYRSWCGTCWMGEQRRAFWCLAKSSLAAGPIPFIVNVLGAPLRNWRFWLGVGAAVFLVRRIRRWRRRRRVFAAARSPNTSS